MPGSHRAEGPTAGRSRGWLFGAAAILLVVVVAAVLLPRLLASSGDGTAKPPATSGVGPTTSTAPNSPTTSPSSSPGGKASRGPSASGTPTTAPSPVPAEPPHRLVIGNLVDAGFAAALQTTTGRLIPDTADQVQRLATRGLPGSPGSDTVVVVGAASSTSIAVFNHLDRLRVGQEVRLETYGGTLTYTVRSETSHAPDTVLGLADVRAHHPGRLVLVVAHYRHGDRERDDRVIVAQLIKAVSERP
ncbi:class F sortase [Nocardioides terrisoli]|uniref:class F sortase n=1 Tax=Nocardioides terrisoli TaxID=3388267 RepID=UPI00287B66A6|nr:class F sortase [Nocardioides marmorisolisilvae]